MTDAKIVYSFTLKLNAQCFSQKHNEHETFASNKRVAFRLYDSWLPDEFIRF